MQRLATAAREFLIWQVLRRIYRDPLWTPPGGDWRLRRLASTYRIKRTRAIRAVMDEFGAEVDELRRENAARHNLRIAGIDPQYRLTVAEHR